MSDRFFDELAISRPTVNLGIGSGPHGAQTGAMLGALEQVISEYRPAAVIVFGDTNSTLAGALAAVKLGVPVIHVEAGLRSFNRTMPEEVNRVIVDHAADSLFAPTPTAVANLASEGLADRTHLTGDIMVDTLRQNVERASTQSTALRDLGLERGGYTLLTLHRPYNVDDPETLVTILRALQQLRDGPIVFPMHPRTRKVLERASFDSLRDLRLIEPMGYLDFVHLQSQAKRVVTDSGGVQKEAFILAVPCVTVRPETEWVETVEAGWNLLLDPLTPDLADRIARFTPAGRPPPVFGEDVADRMVSTIERILGG